MLKLNFMKILKTLKSLNCYSNEGNKWRQSILNLKMILITFN